MSLPVMRRGLSPEGCKNRDRQLGSLTIGLQGVTVHPSHRAAGKPETNFVVENVRRLHQIQTKCRQRSANSRAPQPLRATQHPSLSQVENERGALKRGSVERGGSAHSDYFSLSEDQQDGLPPSLHITGKVIGEEQFIQSSSPPHHPYSHSKVPANSLTTSQGTTPRARHRSPSPGGLNFRPQSPNLCSSRPQSPIFNTARQQEPSARITAPLSPVVLEPIATKLTRNHSTLASMGAEPDLEHSERGLELGLKLSRISSIGGLENNYEDTGAGLGFMGSGMGVGGNIGILETGGLLGGVGLSQEARKQRMGSLMSRIKHQKPSCEVDFNKHCKAIENQHRLLLDSSEHLSLYGSLRGSREDLSRVSSRANSRPDSAKSMRSNSCDRGSQRTKNINEGTKTGRASAIISELKAPKQSAHPSSPQVRKKLTKTINSGTQANAQSLFSGNKKGMKQKAGDASKGLVREPLSKVRGPVRARSNMEKSLIKRDASAPLTSTSRNHAENIDTRLILDNTHSSNGDLNFNSTFSSSGDFDICDQNQSLVGEPGLRLNIRPDSSATEINNRREHYPESPHSVLPSDMYSSHHFALDTEASKDSENLHEQYSNANNHIASRNKEDNLQTNERDSVTGNYERCDYGDRLSAYEIGELQKNNCNLAPGKMDNGGNRDVDDHTALATSIPLSNMDENRTSPSCNLPDVMKNQEERQSRQENEDQGGPTSTLRRSQSLRSLQQQKQQRRPGEVPATYKKGKIPRYLAARREEERKAAEAAAAIDPACPPGHSPLSDHDRCNTLHLLRKSQAEVLRELATLPVAQDTLRVKRVRQDLEDKLTQIEEGLRIFSQPRVYIMNDE